MTIAILTSSRADYGIYLPLLRAMKEDPFFDVRIIAFGTHLSPLHGYTIDTIQSDGFIIDHEVEHILAADSEDAIATSMALVFLKFSDIWKREKKNYDLVFCLGDRYEMFAAVSAAAPFQIPFAHLHGGETTLGAIDNEFRHCITIFSKIHFTATDQYADRVATIKGSKDNVYSVGSLSLQNITTTRLLTKEEFQKKFGIDLSKPCILVTYHPETVNVESNRQNTLELTKALEHFDSQIIITMPNADTMGNTMRKIYTDFSRQNNNVRIVENFGTQGYFTCLNLCSLVVGNSSSGVIEAASFGKYVVNIGDRQKGRAVSANVFHSEVNTTSIIHACEEALAKGEYNGENIYYKENTTNTIVSVLKQWKQ